MIDRKIAITLLVLATMTVLGGYVLGGMVERLASDIQTQRVEALSD